MTAEPVTYAIIAAAIEAEFDLPPLTGAPTDIAQARAVRAHAVAEIGVYFDRVRNSVRTTAAALVLTDLQMMVMIQYLATQTTALYWIAAYGQAAGVTVSAAWQRMVP